MSLCTYQESQRSQCCGWIDMGGTPRLSADEERDLMIRVDQGDVEARDHLIRANLPLVVNVAKGFQRRGAPFADLVSAGNLGLIKAVEACDYRRGLRFSTHAVYWIKQSIHLAIADYRAFTRLPPHVKTHVRKWRRMERELAEILGRHPTHAETAGALGMSKARAAVAIKALAANGARNETPAGVNEGEPTLAETLTGDRKPAVDAMIESEVIACLDQLDEREAVVIRLRFGLSQGAPMTLREVGENLGLTRERVRQIEEEALRKLRAIMDEEPGPRGQRRG